MACSLWPRASLISAFGLSGNLTYFYTLRGWQVYGRLNPGRCRQRTWGTKNGHCSVVSETAPPFTWSCDSMRDTQSPKLKGEKKISTSLSSTGLEPGPLPEDSSRIANEVEEHGNEWNDGWKGSRSERSEKLTANQVNGSHVSHSTNWDGNERLERHAPALTTEFRARVKSSIVESPSLPGKWITPGATTSREGNSLSSVQSQRRYRPTLWEIACTSLPVSILAVSEVSVGCTVQPGGRLHTALKDYDFTSTNSAIYPHYPDHSLAVICGWVHVKVNHYPVMTSQPHGRKLRCQWKNRVVVVVVVVACCFPCKLIFCHCCHLPFFLVKAVLCWSKAKA